MRHRRTMRPLSLSLVLLIGAGACAGSLRVHAPPLPSLETLRREARGAPNDPERWRRLAFAEAGWPGGNLKRARQAVRTALRLRPDDPRLQWLAALLAHASGHHREAFDQALSALEGAARSPGDPEAADAALALLPMITTFETTTWRDALPRLRRLLTPTHRTALGDAYFALAQQVQRLALARGEPETATRAAEAIGCVTRWRVAGPFGHHSVLEFLSSFPPDANPSRPLRERYRLSEDLGERATREVAAPDCSAELAGRWYRAGLWFAEGSIDVPKSGPVRLRVQAPAPFSVWVDGRRIARVEGWRHLPPDVSFFDLELPAGEHRVRIRLAPRTNQPSVHLSWRPGHGQRAHRDDPFEAPTLGTALRLWRQGGHRGRLHAQRWRTRLNGLSPLASWLEEMAWARDPLAGRREVSERRRELLQEAAVEDPELWPATNREAEFLASEGRLLRALQTLDAALLRHPGHPALRAQRIQLLKRREWLEEAAREAEALVRDHPESLTARMTHLDVARMRRRTEERIRAAKALVALDASRSDLFEALLEAQRFDAARAELERLERLDRGEHPTLFLERRLQLAQASGASTDDILELLHALRPPPPPLLQHVLEETDLRAARAGGVQLAVERLREAATHRAFDADGHHRLLERLRSLGADGDVDRYRFAADTVLQNYRERLSAGTLPDAFREAPQVLVFDGSTERLYETGARLRIVHQIYLLQSQQAVDDFGELHVPSGATLLRATTWKPDGTSLEPDDIQGKSSLSFPRLTPGDAVEFEYVEFVQPSLLYPRGASGDNFFFSDRETPFFHSELRIVFPPSQRVLFEELHGAPRHTEEQTEDGLRMLRWVAREVPPAPREPMSPPPDRWLPLVRWAARPIPWPKVMEALYEHFVDKDVADARHEALAARIAGTGSVERRALRLAAWVREHIEPTRDIFGLAAPMVADRRGHPARVLHYLARLAGLPARLVLASDVSRPPEEPPLPNSDQYQHLLVEFTIGDGQSLFLQGPTRHTPLRALPPFLLGCAARHLTPPYDLVRIPDRPPAEVSAVTTRATMQLSQDGAARIEGTMRFEGLHAAKMRQLFSQVSEEQAHEVISRYLPRLWYPGATLLDASWGPIDDPERPLTLHFEMVVESLGRHEGTRWFVPMPSISSDVTQWSALPTREIPLLIPDRRLRRLHLRVELPEGSVLRHAPKPLRLHHPFVGFEQTSRREAPHAFLLERTWTLRGGWLAPEDYAPLAKRARAVHERARAARIVLQMPN